MLASENVRQIATDTPSVYAFHIDGDLKSEELAAVAELLDVAFELYDRINVLFLLHDFSMSDAVSSLSLKTLVTQARSVAHIHRYAVVGAPSAASAMIEISAKAMPVEARAFKPGEEDAAWRFVEAQPQTSRQASEQGSSPAAHPG